MNTTADKTSDPPPQLSHILFADDDEDTRVLIAHHLRKCGHDVLEFADGEGVLDHVGSLMLREDRAAASYQVLLDVRMPGFNGLQILASLRLAGWTSPIVLITAMRRGVADQALRLGATALIHKPFEPRELVEMLGRTAPILAPTLRKQDTASLSSQLRQLCM